MLPLLMTDYFQVKLTGLCYGGCARGVDDCHTAVFYLYWGLGRTAAFYLCWGLSHTGCAYVGSESDV